MARKPLQSYVDEAETAAKAAVARVNARGRNPQAVQDAEDDFGPDGLFSQPFCRWCQNEIRLSNSYDIPHYVHTTAAATLACPGLATGQDVTPA